MKQHSEDHVVVDVEIARTIEEVGGWDATDKMGVACAVVYEFLTDRFKVYGGSAEQVQRLRDRLSIADRITSFNGWRFDFPVIWGKPNGEPHHALAGMCNDLLRRLWLGAGLDPDVYDPTTHGGFSLDAMARATLGRGKIGHGADAPVWFKDGRWWDVVTYCMDDVTLTRDLCIFADNYGYLVRPWSWGGVTGVAGDCTKCVMSKWGEQTMEV